MQPHFLIFRPSWDEFKRKISWALLDDELQTAAKNLFDKYNLSKEPVAAWKICKANLTDEGCVIEGKKFSGKAFSMIKNGQDVAVFIASCGNLDNRIYSDPLESFFSEALKRQACDMAVKYCFDKVSETFKTKVCSINPGSGNPDLWPFEQLKDLFSIIENEKIPVKMLSSGMMHPQKTIAGILFAHNVDFINCQFCSREDCPDRKTSLS